MMSIVEFPLPRKYLENLSRCIRRQIKIFQQFQTYSYFNVIGIHVCDRLDNLKASRENSSV